MTGLPAPGARIGTGLRAEVFAAGDDGALKLWTAGATAADALGEAARQALAAARGAPVPEVHAVGSRDGRWGVLMARCEGPSLADRLTRPGADVPQLLASLAALHLRLHALDGAGLPDQRARMRGRIAGAPGLDEARRAALVAWLDARPPAAGRLCHGDFHPGNVLGRPEAPQVIDWCDATCGEPLADACRSYVLLAGFSAPLAEGYLTAYADAAGVAPEAVLGWLPAVAAARLAEGVAAERPRLMRLASGAPAESDPPEARDLLPAGANPSESKDNTRLRYRSGDR